MKNTNRNKGFWRTVLIIVAAVFIINALSAKGIFSHISQLFSTDDNTSFYVQDNANVLSAESAKYITNKNGSLKAKTGAEIVVVTVSSINGEDIADRAYALFTENKPGDKDKNNGVLLLFAVNNGKYYAIQGRGIEDTLSAGTLQLLLNANAAAPFGEAAYETGIVKSFDAVIEHFEKMYSVSVTDAYSPAHYEEHKSLFEKLGILISGVTGIAKKLIKTMIILIFALFGMIAAIVFIALAVKDKKNTTGTPANNTSAAQQSVKENKNPYSKK